MSKFFNLCVCIVLAGCLALAGCTTDQQAQIDATVQRSLPAVCKNAATARPVVMLLIESGKIKGNKATAVQAAYTSLDAVCVDPSKETAASVLVAALTAYLTISSAMKSAQASS